MRKHVLTVTLALSCAGTLAAQAPAGTGQQNPDPSRSTPQAPATADARNQPVTLVGCLYNERDVPGRTPNVAERAGVLEDYILADASMAQQGAGGRAGTTGAAGTTGTTAARGSMYKVENIEDTRLKALVGKRVEVTGRIDPEPVQGGPGTTTKPQPDRGLGRDQINLPELEATSVREVSGTCPATPKQP